MLNTKTQLSQHEIQSRFTLYESALRATQKAQRIMRNPNAHSYERRNAEMIISLYLEDKEDFKMYLDQVLESISDEELYHFLNQNEISMQKPTKHKIKMSNRNLITIAFWPLAFFGLLFHKILFNAFDWAWVFVPVAVPLVVFLGVTIYYIRKEAKNE
jgi:hypothetical protein